MFMDKKRGSFSNKMGFVLAAAHQQYALGLQAREVLQEQGLARLAGRFCPVNCNVHHDESNEKTSQMAGHRCRVALYRCLWLAPARTICCRLS